MDLCTEKHDTLLGLLNSKKKSQYIYAKKMFSWILDGFLDPALCQFLSPCLGRWNLGGILHVWDLGLDYCTSEILDYIRDLNCLLTINVPVVYMGRYIGCFMYQPWTYNMHIYMPMYVLCNMPF
jgi:hypothetical protein